MSFEQTRFVSLKELTAQAQDVRVLRVTTRSGSSYTVGLLAAPKRTVILRGTGADGARIEIRDPDGQLDDGRGLFSVGPDAWVGAGLEVGSITTSPIVKVEDEPDDREVTAVRNALGVSALVPAARDLVPSPQVESRPTITFNRAAAPPVVQVAAPAEPPPSAYPEDIVEDLEYAASCLRAAYRKRDLIRDLKPFPALEERYGVALSEAALMIQALGRRMRDEGG